MGEVGLFAPLNNNLGIVFSQLAGSGAMYSKMGIEGNTLSIIVRGFHHLSEEGFEEEWELSEQGLDFEDSYEWRVLTVNDEPATVEEFEYMFGAWDWGKIGLGICPLQSTTYGMAFLGGFRIQDFLIGILLGKDKFLSKDLEREVVRMCQICIICTLTTKTGGENNEICKLIRKSKITQ